jgi:hypothetical protein
MLEISDPKTQITLLVALLALPVLLPQGHLLDGFEELLGLGALARNFRFFGRGGLPSPAD